MKIIDQNEIMVLGALLFSFSLLLSCTRSHSPKNRVFHEELSTTVAPFPSLGESDLPEEKNSGPVSQQDSSEEFEGDGDLLDDQEESKPQSVKAKSYIIQAGDSLSSIALKHYGSTKAWKKIFAANKHLKSPNRLRKGVKIILP